MTTSNPTITLNNSDATNFRAWSKAISDALQAVGLVKTADTGQINFTTVSGPSAQAQSLGYEIYRFTDALQGTKPIFFKIEYGSGASSFPQIGLWLTVGSSTDGAGNITGPVISSRRQCSMAGPNVGVPAYFSSDGSYINWFMATNSNGVLGFSIERTRDAQGAATGDGYISYFFSQSVTPFLHVVNLTSATLTSGSTINDDYAVPVLGAWTTSVSAGDTFFFPRIVALPKIVYDLAIMTAYNGDVVERQPVTFVNLGASHTYIPTNQVNPPGYGSMSMLMRYE